MKTRILPILALAVAAGLPLRLGAATSSLTINSPDFLIPLGGQSGTLTLYSDGRAPTTSGFNVLGRQRLTLAGNSVTSGMLTLNLHFSGFSLDPGLPLESAMLQFTVRDLDFASDSSSTGISIRETAALSAINGVPLAAPIQLSNFLPVEPTVGGSQQVALAPFMLAGSMLPASAEPLILTFTLSATLRSHNPQPTPFLNSPENIISDIRLMQSPDPVPEPSTLVLIGLGLVGLMQTWRRHRR